MLTSPRRPLRSHLLLWSASALLAVGFTPRLSATLLVYEPFDYGVGGQLNGQSGGLGFTGSWRDGSLAAATIQSGSLAGPAGLPTLGNHVYLAASTATTLTIWRDINTIGAPGTTTWISFLAQRVGTATDPDVTNLPNNLYPRGVNVSFFSGASGGTGGAEQFGMGNSSNATDDQWSVVPRGSGALRAGAATPWSQLAWGVVRMDHHETASTAYLWINPDPNIEPLIGSAHAVATGFGATNINLIRPFLGNQQGTVGAANWRPAGEMLLDELRIGTTYAAMSMVPEPSAFALAVLAGLTLLFGRRKR